MPGFLLHVNVGMQCTHFAPVTVAPAQPRVVVGGQPVAIVPGLLTVAGCLFTVPGPKPQPCIRVQWTNVSTRVLVAGQAALLQAAPGPGAGVCLSAEQIPAGPPLVTAMQMRVTAS